MREKSEQLSAAVDGENEGEELQRLIDQLLVDPQLRAAWARYHLIGDALSHELPVQVDLELQERVRDRLQYEPDCVAPPAAKVVRPKRWGKGWLKPIAASAIAASVAAVAILGLQRLHQPQQEVVIASKPEVVEYLRAPKPILAKARSGEGVKLQVQERLDRYLLNHNEYSITSGIHGVLPYARVVSGKGTK